MPFFPYPHPLFREAIMPDQRRVSLFRNGSNQAIRIPRGFELAGTEAILRRDGNRLIIEPVPSQHPLLALLATLELIDEAFPDVAQPALPDEVIF
jgi:antitoxin VapB